MAKLIETPAAIADQFKLDWSKDTMQQLNQQQKEIDRLAKENHGKISFSVADGSAIYIVMSLKPAKLMHIPFCDGYRADPALIRGLTGADIQHRAVGEEKIAALFGRKG